MAPSPATTSSSRAITEPVARRPGSMVRCVVASLVARSSCRACSSNASILWLFQSMARLRNRQLIGGLARVFIQKEVGCVVNFLFVALRNEEDVLGPLHWLHGNG